MRTLTTKQLGEALGVTRQVIENWRRQGFPAKKIGEGRAAKLVFNIEDVLGWFSGKPKMTKYALSLKAAYKIEDKPKAAKRKKKDESSQENIKTILDRLRGIERYTYKNYEEADEDLKAFWIEHHRNSAEQLRKWEKEWAAIQYNQGTVISKDDHESSVKEMCMTVRNALLNLANKCAPLCANKDARQVMKIIHEEVLDCMRALSK